MQGMIVTPKIILSSASRTSSGTSNSFKVRASYAIRLYVDVTVEPGSATLDIVIQTSPDNSKWYTAATMAQIVVIGQYTGTASIIGPYMRISYTIGGSNGFTFGVKMSKMNFAK